MGNTFKDNMSDEQFGQLREAVDNLMEQVEYTWLHCPLDDAPRVRLGETGSLREQLYYMLENTQVFLRAYDLGRSLYDYLINKVGWSDEDLEMWGKRMNKGLTEEQADEFDERIDDIIYDYIQQTDADFSMYDLEETYNVCVDWMWDVYEGLKERYGI